MGISSIISSAYKYGKVAYKYGKQVLKATPELTFGTSAEKVGKVLRDAYTSGKSLRETASLGMKAVEKAGQGGFLTRMGKNIKNLFPDIARYTKAGSKLAKMKGTNRFLGGLKGLGKGIGKKLPFIFAATTVVTEIPNIIKATKDKGIFQGIKETIKPVVRLAGAGIGAAIGSAVAPGIGSMVGWFAGEWLAGKITGKSYSEKQAEKEEIIAQYIQDQGIDPSQAETELQPQPQPLPQDQVQPQVYPWQTTTTNPFNFGMNPYYSNQIPYADDIMMRNLSFNTLC